MRRMLFASLALALAAGGHSAGAVGTAPAPEFPTRTVRAPAGARRPSLVFEENRGQVDSRVAFFVRGRDLTVFFTSEGITYALGRGERRHAIRAVFLDAAPVRPEGLDASPGVVSYFRGPKSEWIPGCPTFRAIRWRNLWPGVDLTVLARPDALEAVYTVRPGADPSRIRLRYEGAEGVSTAPDGTLEVRAPFGGLAETAPRAFQGSEVPAAFRVTGSEVSFTLGAYDRATPLTIDPAVTVYSGFIGGSLSDEATAIDVDDARRALVAGATASAVPTFPVLAGPYLAPSGNWDVFVAKLSVDGVGFVYCGFLGGARDDRANDVAVGLSGEAFVVGRTRSTEATFPVLTGPDLTFNGVETSPGVVDADAFVAAIDATGTTMLYCGYVGGSQEDTAEAVAVDILGNAHVAGTTSSTESTFPVLFGPDLTANGGPDAFVARVHPGGLNLAWCGFIGGAAADYGLGVGLDPARNVFVAGHTASAEDTFPVAAGFDMTHNGGFDAFLAKVSASSAATLFATYFGGSGNDLGTGLAVDAAGNAYLVGETSSDESTFPVKNGPDLEFSPPYGAYLQVPLYGTEAYVAKIATNGLSVRYAGYIGGIQDDYALAVAVDPEGSALVTGGSRSRRSVASDAFLVRVDPQGASTPFAAYLGVANDVPDHGNDVAVDDLGDAYVAGFTTSAGNGLPALSGPGLALNGGTEAFVFHAGELSTGLSFRSGALKNGPRAAGDSFKLTGTLDLPPEVVWMFSPVSEGLTITTGGYASPFVLAIPPGSPGWKVSGGKYAWKGTGGKVTFDMAKRTFSIAFSRIDFPAPQTNPIQVLFRCGGATAHGHEFWTENAKAPGNFKFP